MQLQTVRNWELQRKNKLTFIINKVKNRNCQKSPSPLATSGKKYSLVLKLSLKYDIL